jgi:hypothetical protein
VQPLAEDTLLLHLQTPRTGRLRFLAGQSVTLYGGAAGIDAQATYPIASCPCDDRNLHFHIARSPGDALAELLFGGAIHTGDALRLWGPAGEFLLAESDRVRVLTPLDSPHAGAIALVSVVGMDMPKLGSWLFDTYRIVNTPIVHPEFSGLRITPNVYTTLDEVDLFAEKVLEGIRKSVA